MEIPKDESFRQFVNDPLPNIVRLKDGRILVCSIDDSKHDTKHTTSYYPLFILGKLRYSELHNRYYYEVAERCTSDNITTGDIDVYGFYRTYAEYVENMTAEESLKFCRTIDKAICVAYFMQNVCHDTDVIKNICVELSGGEIDEMDCICKFTIQHLMFVDKLCKPRIEYFKHNIIYSFKTLNGEDITIRQTIKSPLNDCSLVIIRNMSPSFICNCMTLSRIMDILTSSEYINGNITQSNLFSFKGND